MEVRQAAEAVDEDVAQVGHAHLRGSCNAIAPGLTSLLCVCAVCVLCVCAVYACLTSVLCLRTLTSVLCVCVCCVYAHAHRCDDPESTRMSAQFSLEKGCIIFMSDPHSGLHT